MSVQHRTCRQEAGHVGCGSQAEAKVQAFDWRCVGAIPCIGCTQQGRHKEGERHEDRGRQCADARCVERDGWHADKEALAEHANEDGREEPTEPQNG